MEPDYLNSNYLPSNFHFDPRRSESYFPVPGAGGYVIHVRAPGGGVPAFNSGTGQMGSATCTVLTCSSTGLLTSSASTMLCYNAAGAVAANAYGIVSRNDAGLWVWVVENC